MPNPKPKSPKKSSVSISHKSYGEMLDKQPKKPFAGTEYVRLFGYQSQTGGTRKKNKRKRKTYKRKCK